MTQPSIKLILRALADRGDNKAEAARRLGVSERTLWDKVVILHGLRRRHEGQCLQNYTTSAIRKLSEYEADFADRDEAMFRAYESTAFTMVEIGAHFGVGYQTVSRAVKRHGGR